LNLPAVEMNSTAGELLFEGIECWPDFQVPPTAAFDRDKQLSIAKCRTVTISLT
jgi:hypothetical protein